MKVVVLVTLGAFLVSACRGAEDVTGVRATGPVDDRSSSAPPSDELDDAPAVQGRSAAEPDRSGAAAPTITLAFAGDVHFEGALADLPRRRGSTLGPMSRWLRTADLAMVNLESPVTRRDDPAAKELERAGNRYWFRSAPGALDVLRRSGVDVVSVANNHAGDHGVGGLRDTLRAAGAAELPVVGIGVDRDRAFAPHRVTIRGTTVAVLAADSSFRESTDPIWDVRPGSGPGIAAARVPDTDQLVAAVARAALVDDLVVVYLHWGDEGDACVTRDQRSLARTLSEAGADIVVGAHSHVPMGSGRLEGTYVSYGLGNFLWYTGARSDSGVLRLQVRGGEVVAERWRPARIPPGGGVPQPLQGRAEAAAVADQRALRACTDLEPLAAASGTPAQAGDELPAYTATIRPIGQALRQRMRGSSHDPARCPVPLADLRRLDVRYVDLDGRAQRGEMVVHRDVARDVVGVFETLYDERFPIRRMRLVDAYGGDDNASMAANNTSAYNCRTVAGQSTFSDHAYGRAIDINPVQNPYVLGGRALPPRGRGFVDVDRGAARVEPRRDPCRGRRDPGVRGDRLDLGRHLGGAGLPALQRLLTPTRALPATAVPRGRASSTRVATLVRRRFAVVHSSRSGPVSCRALSRGTGVRREAGRAVRRPSGRRRGPPGARPRRSGPCRGRWTCG